MNALGRCLRSRRGRLRAVGGGLHLRDVRDFCGCLP